jgi:dihydroxy-acid dehydratase
MVNQSQQRSRKIRKDWIQVDALCCGAGWDEEDLKKPQILVEDVFGSSHPGSIHLDRLAEEVSIGVFQEPSPPGNPQTICHSSCLRHRRSLFDGKGA